MLRIMLQIYRNILSSQCHIKYVSDRQTPDIDAVEVYCNNSQIKVSLLQNKVAKCKLKMITQEEIFIPATVLTSDQSNSIQFLNDAILIQNTLKECSTGITSLSVNFRLQVTQLADFSVYDAPVRTVEHFQKLIVPNSLCELSCSNCSHILSSDPLLFQGVQEFCSPFTSELSESWFCHKNHNISFRQDHRNLYVDDVALYLHMSFVTALLLECSDNNFICTSCCKAIGMKQPGCNFVKFYLDEVQLKNSSDSSVYNTSNKIRLKMSLLAVMSLIKGSQKMMNCKMLLQSKSGEETRCLLLWVPSGPVDQFLLEAPLTEIPAEVTLKTEPVYRVFYVVGSPSDDRVRSWRRDFAVDFCELSCGMMSSLADFLESSHRIPDAGLDGFSSGCLPLRPSDHLLEKTPLQVIRE